jgi:hypothetical protein
MQVIAKSHPIFTLSVKIIKLNSGLTPSGFRVAGVSAEVKSIGYRDL